MPRTFDDCEMRYRKSSNIRLLRQVTIRMRGRTFSMEVEMPHNPSFTRPCHTANLVRSRSRSPENLHNYNLRRQCSRRSSYHGREVLENFSVTTTPGHLTAKFI